MKRLNRSRYEQLLEALLSAFPKRSDVDQLVRFALDENLSTISEGPNLRSMVFDLISWAEKNDRLDDLINGAYSAVPRNPALREFIQEWNKYTPSTKPPNNGSYAPIPLLPQRAPGDDLALPIDGIITQVMAEYQNEYALLDERYQELQVHIEMGQAIVEIPSRLKTLQESARHLKRKLELLKEKRDDTLQRLKSARTPTDVQIAYEAWRDRVMG